MRRQVAEGVQDVQLQSRGAGCACMRACVRAIVCVLYRGLWVRRGWGGRHDDNNASGRHR